jgi:hypothetical protein
MQVAYVNAYWADPLVCPAGLSNLDSLCSRRIQRQHSCLAPVPAGIAHSPPYSSTALSFEIAERYSRVVVSPFTPPPAAISAPCRQKNGCP